MLPRSAARIVSSTLAACLSFTPTAWSADTPPLAEPAKVAQPTAVDVSLRPDGLLIGQLVSPEGSPVVDAPVVLTTSAGQEASTRTNQDGAFAFRGVRGVTQLSGPQAHQVVRGWAAGTAPPNAAPALLLVQQDPVARGQRPAAPAVQGFVSRSKRLMANPLFVAGAVATAVAIPVAIHNADDDDPAS